MRGGINEGAGQDRIVIYAFSSLDGKGRLHVRRIRQQQVDFEVYINVELELKNLYEVANQISRNVGLAEVLRRHPIIIPPS